MFDMLEALNLKDALKSLEDLDIRRASSVLLQALGYIYSCNTDFEDDTLEKFIYYSAPKKAFFTNHEIKLFSEISDLHYIGDATQKNLLGSGFSSKKLVLISAELKCSNYCRSQISYNLTQAICKLFNDYVLIVFRFQNEIEFCTFDDNGIVYISDWINTREPKNSELFKLLQLSPSYVLGVKTLKDFYDELSFALSREYIVRPESYEYQVYECFPKLDDDINEAPLTKKAVVEYSEQSRSYYKCIYGDDYVAQVDLIMTLDDNDEEWTLFELNDFFEQESNTELESDFDKDGFNDINDEGFDISDDIMSDPVKLLEYLESLPR
ncbi:hypothetical protein C4565_08905 [Candidatus Parcubacteria bacterium]|jgi:hypothetical protein|nr:MAG: hypothetical protein C4565_08905 [Candidatus Parcubacteria bacterium]